MKYRHVLMLDVLALTCAALLSSGGVARAAGQCRGVKLYRQCNPNGNYAFCNGDLMCQSQADAVATTSTCYSLQVPCAFDKDDLGDVAFALFRYPIVGTQYNVPRGTAQ